MPKLYHNGDQWQVPGKQDKDARRFDIPSSPHDLAAWLNQRDVAFERQLDNARRPQLADQADAGDPLATAQEAALARIMEEARSRCPKCGDKPSIAAAIVESRDLLAITEWILDEATPEQVENILTAIGVRFHELRKEAGR